MVGTIPLPGGWSMVELASYLTIKEQLNFAQLVDLKPDSTTARNMATFIDQPAQLGPLSVVGRGDAGQGTKILSTTAFISGTKTDIDLYRLPLA
jgi:hypothetical protein